MRFTDGERRVGVLFVCDDNASLSLIAESIVRSLGSRRFMAASAGVEPAAVPEPLVLDFLQQRHMPVDGLHPKSLQVACAGRRFDYIITLTAHAGAALAAREPETVASWNLQDLADEMGDAHKAPHAVRDAFWVLMRRIKIFASLPHSTLPRRALQHRLEGLAAWG